MRSYKFRLYPTGRQSIRLSKQFETCRLAYNELLQIKIATYEATGKNLSKFDLDKCIKYLGVDTVSVHSQVLQNLNDRINKAFANFFRRVKEKKQGKNIKVGYPRFKKFYRSITFPQSGFKIISQRMLRVNGFGNIPFVLHRMPKGKIKTMTIGHRPSGKWFVSFSCEIDNKKRKHPKAKKKIGIDVNLENFAMLSDGTEIENHKFFVNSQKRLARLQRRLSRKKKGSKNRNKTRIKFARLHEKVANQRLDFFHKTANDIIKEHGFIAVENLNIRGMVRNRYLAKSISDVSWNKFIEILVYKAESAGGRVISVNPRNTTQECSRCHKIVRKSLAVRIHSCPNCGLVLHRDINSALNILERATTVGQTGSHASGDCVRPSSRGKATVLEGGTIHG